MTRSNPTNKAASVRQRLQNLARQHKEDFQLALSRYASERLLQRLSLSNHHGRFVLKGAMLFPLWTDQPYRPTRDIDFLAHGNHSALHLEEVFREVCSQSVEDDGLVFPPTSVVGSVIKPDQEYEGVRIHLEAKLERARISVQIDIGFGDTITPDPVQIQYPSMLGFPTPVVLTYPKETVVAEKLHAMVVLGMTNSRMKDFFDLWILAQRFPFDGLLVTCAIRATFERRRTPIPAATPMALTDAFDRDESKQRQWRAFTTKVNLAATPSLPELITRLQTFLLPPLEAAQVCKPVRQQWIPPGPWRLE
jgi:hypothetical protein